MHRDDLDVHLVVMFSSLLFLKCFHWISTDRVDYVSRDFVLPDPGSFSAQMDQFPPPGPPIRFHLRLLSAISSLAILDVFAVIYCYRLVMQGDGKGAISGASIFFGTEVSFRDSRKRLVS
jgi:E3 ubiquitin-protein ligase synoviolin